MTRAQFARALTLALGTLALITTGACGGSETQEPIQFEPRAAQPSSGDEPAPTVRGGLVVSNDACTTDADCVPAACCHAAACVARANAPACGEAMCTQDCRFGTLDCGGSCLCQEGRCAARLSEPPAMLQPDAPPSGS